MSPRIVVARSLLIDPEKAISTSAAPAMTNQVFHLLAFDHIAALERLFKSLFCRFFCFVEFAGFFCHAMPRSDTWSKVRKNAVQVIDKCAHRRADHHNKKQKPKDDRQRQPDKENLHLGDETRQYSEAKIEQ